MRHNLKLLVKLTFLPPVLILGLKLTLHLVLLPCKFLKHSSIVLHLLKHSRVHGTATTSTATFLKAFVLFLELSDQLVLSRLVNLGLVLNTLDLPGVPKCTKGLLIVNTGG